MKHILIAIATIIAAVGCSKPQQEAYNPNDPVRDIQLIERTKEHCIFLAPRTGPMRYGWITLDDEKSEHKSVVFDAGRMVDDVNVKAMLPLPERSKTQFTLIWFAIYNPLDLDDPHPFRTYMGILAFYSNEIFGVSPDLMSIDIGKEKSASRDYVRKVLTAQGFQFK